MEDGGLVQISEVAHVLASFKFWRINLLNLILLQQHLLTTRLHHHLVSLSSLDDTLSEASLLTREPAGLLGIIGLGQVLLLLFIGDEEVGSGVRVWFTSSSSLDVTRHDPG